MKKPSYSFRLFLNLIMLLLLCVSLAFRITGDHFHEWVGLVTGLLFLAHAVINRRWYRNLLRGRHDVRRTMNTVLNLALAVCALVMIVSGLLHSRYIFDFGELSGEMTMRQIHSTAAYWLLVLVSLHLGMHWQMVLNFLGRRWQGGSTRLVALRKWGLRVAGLAIAVCGIWAFEERGIFEKLFLGYSFDFWDPDTPAIYFLLANLGITGLGALVAHYLLKMVDLCKRKRPLRREGAGETFQG